MKAQAVTCVSNEVRDRLTLGAELLTQRDSVRVVPFGPMSLLVVHSGELAQESGAHERRTASS